MNNNSILNAVHQSADTCPALQKLSHKKWKALIKKQKRKKRRQTEAQARDLVLQVEGGEDLASDVDDEAQEAEEKKSQEQHALWEQRERLAQAEWRAQKQREENERARKQAEEAAIKAEWEERMKKEAELEEKEREKRAKQAKLLRQATANTKQGGDSWSNPLAPTGYSAERKSNPCPFFLKVGACRFGDQCSRTHEVPETSSTLLIPGMYSHFALAQGLLDEYDTDLALEYEENDTYHHFHEFYDDVLPEFKAIGRVIQFKVCCNYEPHLRGNVYVQYLAEEDAKEAFMKFNGRYYGGHQLQCSFTSIVSWKSAICGLFSKKSCPKGKSCNFLHVFSNPGREYADADMDLQRHGTAKNGDRSHRSRRGYFSDYRSRSYRRSRSRSRSRERKYTQGGDRRSSVVHRNSSRYRSRSSSRSRTGHQEDKKRSSSQSHKKRSHNHRDGGSESRSHSRSRSRSHKSKKKKKSKKSSKHKSKDEESSRENDATKDNIDKGGEINVLGT